MGQSTLRQGTDRSAVIAGLGITEMGKVYGRSTADFAADAVRRAVADARLELSDLDGLLVSTGVTQGVGMELARRLGLRDLGLLSVMTAYGATAGAMLTQAVLAVESGMVDSVACVFADAPLQEHVSTGAVYSFQAFRRTGFASLIGASGFTGANSFYAVAARRHMEAYGTTTEQFGAVAVSQRQWAQHNPLAQMREPITLEDHQRSRWVVEPLRLLDCCLVSNGGVALVVTRADRARHGDKPPVHVWGWGQGHPGHMYTRGSDFGLTSGAGQSGRTAMAMAGITTADVDVCEFYDCYTYTVLVTLEDYGFCAKGEAGAFAESGALGPGGSLPTNTGGGQLSGFYMWGMTPLSEGVIQARGEGGDRQVQGAEVVLVSGNGGILDHHATVILGAHPR